VDNGVMTFAERLRTLRKRSKLTQEQLAHRAGFSGQSRIANYESGAREPELSELPAMADALSVPVGALIDDRDFYAVMHSESKRPALRAIDGRAATAPSTNVDVDLLALVMTQVHALRRGTVEQRMALAAMVYERVLITGEKPTRSNVLRLIQAAG
jgi:transcriptional regulator with XRE-family HTH domain